MSNLAPSSAPADALGQQLALGDDVIVVTDGVQGYDIGARVRIASVEGRWVTVRGVDAGTETVSSYAGGHFVAITTEEIL